ncbi:hypothetical protein BDR26DRAFT_950920 [Obelidium mucronatum]|nr:hypothetical protein BDR26DRAFT_950920 [Obelidium mucronatum]
MSRPKDIPADVWNALPLDIQLELGPAPPAPFKKPIRKQYAAGNRFGCLGTIAVGSASRVAQPTNSSFAAVPSFKVNHAAPSFGIRGRQVVGNVLGFVSTLAGHSAFLPTPNAIPSDGIKTDTPPANSSISSEAAGKDHFPTVSRRLARFFMWAPESGEFAPRHSKDTLQSNGNDFPATVGRPERRILPTSCETRANRRLLVRFGSVCYCGNPHLFIEFCPNKLIFKTGVLDEKSNVSGSGPHLYFAKAVDGNLWVPVLEKGYAKAHSSYASIHGGHIGEALFDLTGFPTESICFGSVGFDSEIFWTRLLSFQSQGFLMGAVCPKSGDGLVGGHAYSFCRLWRNQLKMGWFLEEPKLCTIISTKEAAQQHPERKFHETEEFGVTDHGTLRLIKLRNPWGRVEWKGRFGVDSAEWSASLRKRLNEPEHDISSSSNNSSEQGGVFWMSTMTFCNASCKLTCVSPTKTTKS